jgi:hypothetical protein
LESNLPRRFQQLEPLHLVSHGVRQIVCLDPDDDMPAGDGNRELTGAFEQVLIDRGVRHQQLGQQLAARPHRHHARLPGQVEEPPGGQGGGVQDQPGANAGVAVCLRGGKTPDQGIPYHDRHADLIRIPGTRFATRAARRARRVARFPVGGGSAVAGSERPELDRGPERPAHRRAQCVEIAAGFPGTQHRVQRLLGPAERELGAAPDGPHDRAHQLGQLGVPGDRNQRDVGPPGDVGHGHGRPPLFGREGRHGGDPVDRCPAQSHVQAVVGDLRGGGPGQHNEAGRRGVV